MDLPDSPRRDLIDTFRNRLALAGGNALTAASLDEIVALVRGIKGTAWITEELQRTFPGIASALRDAGIQVETAQDPAAVRDAPLGLTVARLAIAETGSVLLHENDLASRSVSLMTQRLIVACPASALVASLDDAAPVLREVASSGPSYATLVTGPSRTADIERELAVGVQGPGELQVVFVQDGAS